MIVSSQVKTAVEAVLKAALPLENVFRSRNRALPESMTRALNVRLGIGRGTLYTVGGGIDWTIDIELSAMSRSGDEDAADLLQLAHDALIVDLSLGVPNLAMDPAFTITEDGEDLEEDVAAAVAIYTFQICTENSHAN